MYPPLYLQKLEDTFGYHINRDASRYYVSLHCNPDRRYHGLGHIEDCLKVSQQFEYPLLDLALIFHDAVYDVRRSDNEERSANLGYAMTGVEGIRSLIMATDHKERGRTNWQRNIQDIDLSVLASDPTKYDLYTQGVYYEYERHFTPAQVRQGRIDFLTNFLKRKKIYHTRMGAEWEDAARENLGRELTTLREHAKVDA